MSLISENKELISEYLRDESRLRGEASSISFPETEADIVTILDILKTSHSSVTVQGARTGITGGAVPAGGHIMNLGRMKEILSLRYDEGNGSYLLCVQPGLTLTELREVIRNKEFKTDTWDKDSLLTLKQFKNNGLFFFPPDPTEPSASIGGMVACDAKGASSFAYGATRQYVEQIRIILPDGSTGWLTRGVHRAEGRRFSFTCENGRVISGKLPSYNIPGIKNAAGFYTDDTMDLADLIIGSEGTLCIISAIELRLIPRPPHVWGITVFLPDETNALHFVRAIRDNGNYHEEKSVLPMKPAAIEFFDSHALHLLMEQKELNPAFSYLHTIPEGAGSAVYVEYHGWSEDEVSYAVMAMCDIMKEYGVDENKTWIASNAHEMEHLTAFRHAIPEVVNMYIDRQKKTCPSIIKLGTDMAVHDEKLFNVYSLYCTGLEKEHLSYVIFGHVGNNHFHVNILPRTDEEYERGRKLYRKWAERVVAMRGTISAEHGTGKLKKDLLRLMFGDKGIHEMMEVKHIFDPDVILNPGNLF
jgi:D-lactate dehydrogenase (cytochrome)